RRRWRRSASSADGVAASWLFLLRFQTRHRGVEAEGAAKIVAGLKELGAEVERLADELAVIALHEDQVGQADVPGLVGLARRLEDILAARDGVGGDELHRPLEVLLLLEEAVDAGARLGERRARRRLELAGVVLGLGGVV